MKVTRNERIRGTSHGWQGLARFATLATAARKADWPSAAVGLRLVYDSDRTSIARGTMWFEEPHEARESAWDADGAAGSGDHRGIRLAWERT